MRLLTRGPLLGSYVVADPYLGARTVVVCWRPPRGPATPLLFYDDVSAAVAWLNHLEAAYPAQREKALLLVGVAEPAEIGRALWLTHPLYVRRSRCAPKVLHPLDLPLTPPRSS